MSAFSFPGSQLVTASAAIGIAGKPKIIYAIHIISAGTLSVATIKNNGSGGTTYIAESGTANKGVTFTYGLGMFFPTDAYFTADGNLTSALVSYSEV